MIVLAGYRGNFVRLMNNLDLQMCSWSGTHSYAGGLNVYKKS